MGFNSNRDCVEFRVLSVGDGISVFPSDWGFPAPWGVGEFGGVMEGRSSRDPAPRISTDPKCRFLGAVDALRDRDRKLYPDPGGRAGTSEADWSQRVHRKKSYCDRRTNRLIDRHDTKIHAPIAC